MDALGVISKVLEPLRTPTVGLGGLLNLAKTGDIQQASQSIQERKGLGHEIVGDQFQKEHPWRTIGLEMVTDPLNFITLSGGKAALMKLAGKAPKVSKAAEGVQTAARMVDEIPRPPADPLPTLKEDISTTAGKIEKALQQIDKVAETGTYQPKGIRPELGKGAPANVESLVSEGVVEEANRLYVQSGRELKRLLQRAEQEADDFTTDQLRSAEERFRNAFAKRGEAARTASESLAAFKHAVVDEVADVAKMMGLIKNVKPKLANLDKIILGATRNAMPGFADKFAKNIGLEGLQDVPQNLKLPKAVVDYLRVNLFSMGSWTLDAFTNTLAVGAKMPGYLLRDVYDIAKGQTPARTFGIIKAIKEEGKGLGKAIRKQNMSEMFNLPSDVDTALGGAVGGEKVGRMTNMHLGKLNMDYVIGLPVRMKGGIDALFSRTFAKADLISSAVEEAAKKGLKGIEKERFIDDFVKVPTQAAKDSAITLGKQIRFDANLSKIEEHIASSMGFQLLGDAFPRWAFQFSRWAGRTLGANPEFFSKVKSGTVKAPEVIQYLTEAATGWGGVHLFKDAIYPSIDFNSMEYVNDKKERIRLSGRSPFPEMAFLVAVMKGDVDKSRKALEYASIPFGKILSGAPGGLIENWISGLRQVGAGEMTSQRFIDEFNNLVNRAIPGQAVLSTLKTFSDPKVRRGIGAELPGVSQLLPAKVNPATGGAVEPRQKFLGLEMPAIGGIVLPGAKRVLTPVENELLSHGVGLFRPRRTPVAEFETRDVPKELRADFEVKAGKMVDMLISKIMAKPEYKKAPEEAKAEVLRAAKAGAEQVALAQVAKARGVVLRGKEPNIRMKLLPEKFLQDAGIKKDGKWNRR